MKFLFEVADFNSLDHFTPVAVELLKSGNCVVFFLNDQSVLTKDSRIKHLTQYEKFEGIKVQSLKTRRVELTFTFLSRLLFGRHFSRFGFVNLRAWLLVQISKILFLYRGLQRLDFDCAISGWGDPSSYTMTLALSRNKPIVALPHGYPCLKNSIFNREIERVLAKTGKLPDFSLRNLFDCYVVATERNRLQLRSWNIRNEKLEVWGNARFSPDWIKTLLSILPPVQIPSDEEARSKVLFLLPAPTSNFRRRELHSLLNELVKLPIVLLLKTHTRVPQSINIVPPELLKLSSVVDVSEESTTRLIECSTTVINFATGTALDAVFIGRRLIFAKYLSDNSYSWEDCPAIKIADSEEECLFAVADSSWMTETELCGSYLAQEVFADGKIPNPPLHYATRLVEIAAAGRR